MAKYLDISEERWNGGRSTLTPSEHNYLAVMFARNVFVLINKKAHSKFLRYRESPTSRQLLEKVWCNS